MMQRREAQAPACRIARFACFILSVGDARLRQAPYRSCMQFPDSTFAALDISIEEPSGFGSLLVLAIVLTLAAVSAGLLVSGV